MSFVELVCFCATELHAHCGVDAHIFVEELQNKQNKVKLGTGAQGKQSGNKPKSP